jgi:outer membrane protein, heavy metal efflux system
MKNWNRCQLGLVLAAVLVRGVVAAGSDLSTNVSTAAVDALVAEVVERNPELNFYRAEIAAAKGERRTAAAWANPELSGSLGHKQVRGGGLSDEGLAWSVSVQQTIEWPGRIPLRKAIANHQVQLAELGLAQFKMALAARTRALAHAAMAAQERVATAQEVADRFEQLREVLVQRDPAGLTPLLETRIIEATELTLKRKSSEAALAAQTAMLELNQLRGVPWLSTLKLEPAPLAFSKAPHMDALLAATRTNNFDLRMRQAEVEQQGFKVSLARKEGYPAFSVGPYFSQEKAGDREQQAGVAISLPLPLWKRGKGDVEVAEARQRQAETSLLVLQREIERKVVAAALTYDTKLREISKWRADSVAEFRKAAELADRHYRLGAVPIATYVELQKQYLEAVEALLDTRREALEAVQELQLLTGLDIDAVRLDATRKEESK